uniref:Dynein axonemal assembly factor 8 n=1 Tax=Amphiprion ocellaris TaxID=80972 RepID=A0AAQ5ZHE4_AMPOC
MDPNRSSCCNSILEKVKPHLPTIDFDFSTCQKDEVVTVYQRPAGLSLKVPEDFNNLSVDDAELEELLKAQISSEEIHRQLDDDNDNGNVENNSAAQQSTGPSDADDEAGAYATSFVVSNNKAKPDASFKPNVGSTKSKEGLPVLSFARLDQWDLDAVLQNLKASRVSLQEHAPVEPVRRREVPTRCSFINGDNRRSQEDIMERLTALCMKQSVSEPVKNPGCIRQNSIWDKLLEKMSTQLNSHAERPTVYMDLRCPDPSIKPVRTSPDLSLEPQSATNTQQDEQCPSVHSRKSNRETDQQSLIKEPKQQSDQHRLETFQHEQKQEILKLLEKHRPIKSVHQKQPAAEKTDVLFDIEASQLESVSSLPAGIESKGRMLLIINLSSPGMVAAHGKRKHPAATKSHIYNTLVAWLLSLAGPDQCHDEDQANAPFWVAGLQQLWTEDGLTLQVLAVARRCYKPRKRDVDIHAPFYHHVSKFLSETSLTVIASWLPRLQHMLDQQAYTSPIHLPPSCLSSFISTTSNKNVIDRTFGLSPGFYWQTVETQDHICKGRETSQEQHIEVSVVLGCSGFFQHPLITHHTLQLVLELGLDVCGLRLLYPPQTLLSDGGVTVNQRADEPNQPVLAFAVRGPYAHSLLKDFIHASEPMLLKKIEKPSVKPLHNRNEEPRLVCSPQLVAQVHRELCLWFSGRLEGGGVQNHNQHVNSVVPLDDRFEGIPSNLSRPPSFLCATTKADLLLVVSPVVPPRCYGQVLAGCERRGFSLRGLQRLQLHNSEAAILGLSNLQASVFCSPTTATLDQQELKLPSHCLVLLLRKENALRHSVGLPSALMRGFKAEKLPSCFHSSLCFHTVPYSSNLLHILVRCMWAVPDPSSVILSRQKCSCSSDMEQVVILTLCGKDMSQGLNLLHRVLIEESKGDDQHAGFELLGLKWLPVLTRLQAQELSPYEVGEALCYDSVDTLMSYPALVCALRRCDAFASLRKLLPHNCSNNLSVLMSPTPEAALRQASLFFFKHEMIPGSRSYQEALKDVKSLFPEGLCCTETSTMRQEQILSLCSDALASVEREQRCMLTHVAQESLSGASLRHRSLWQTTCLLIPLNAPQHSPVYPQLEMVEQLLRAGCHLVAGRMSKLDQEQKEHIAETLAVSSSGREKMEHFDRAPCLIMALQGEKIVAGLRLILESICKERSDLEKVVMIYPESEKEATQLMFYLFDATSPETCDTTLP